MRGPVCKSMATRLKGSAVMDAEIVYLDEKGVPNSIPCTVAPPTNLPVPAHSTCWRLTATICGSALWSTEREA
jgi:hypothetical protein